MTSIIWTWQDFWNWFEQIEDERDKTIVLKQVDAKWIIGVTSENQAKIFQHAPMEIINQISHWLKPEAKELLGIVKRRKLRRSKI